MALAASLEHLGTRFENPGALVLADALGPRTDDLFGMVGRLADGASLESLQAELASIDRSLAPLYPAGVDGFEAVVRPLLDEVVGTDLRDSLWLLLAAALGLFLAVSANVGQLWDDARPRPVR